jgi:hypothetical protein
MIVHSAMQVLTNLELAISKAYISLHGEWFMDNVCALHILILHYAIL